eukprot:gene12497-15711_t
MSDLGLQQQKELLDTIKCLPPQLQVLALSQLQLLAPGFAPDVGSSRREPLGGIVIDQDRLYELPGLKNHGSLPSSVSLGNCKRASSERIICTSPPAPVTSESLKDGGVCRSHSTGAVSNMRSSSTQATVSYGFDDQPSSPSGTPESKLKNPAVSTPADEQKDDAKDCEPRLSQASSAAAQAEAAEVGRCGPISSTDLEMAQKLMSLADKTIGNPAIMLQNLLGFEPADYCELLTAHTESKCSYTDTIACYLHNLRTMAEDAAAEPDAESDEMQKEIRDNYKSKMTELIQVSMTGVRVEHKAIKLSKDKQLKDQQQQLKEQQRAQQSAHSAGAKISIGGRRGGRGRDQRLSRTSQSGVGAPLRAHHINQVQPQAYPSAYNDLQSCPPAYTDLERYLHNQCVSSGRRTPSTSSNNLPPPPARQSPTQPPPDQLQALLQQILAQQGATNNHQALSPAGRPLQHMDSTNNLLPHPFSSNQHNLNPSYDPALVAMLQGRMVSPNLMGNQNQMVNQNHIPQHMVTHPNQQSDVMQQFAAHQNHQMQMMARTFPRTGSNLHLHSAASNPGHMGMPPAMHHHPNQYTGQYQVPAFNTELNANNDMILRHLLSQLGSMDMQV